MIKRFDAVIFDMDGLLLDTEGIALDCFRQTCQQFGIGDQTQLFMQCVGTNATRSEEILREGLRGKVSPVDFGLTWDAGYVQKTTGVPIPLKDGAQELLGHLARTGIPIAVATSTSRERALQKLEAAGISGSFANVVGGDQVKNSKPAPDIYLKAAELLGVQPVNCLALEDSENGVRAAVNAGMTVIQIPDLVIPTQALTRLGHIIHQSLREVRAYLPVGTYPA